MRRCEEGRGRREEKQGMKMDGSEKWKKRKRGTENRKNRGSKEAVRERKVRE